jgi:carbamoyl-phosphate synthase large subunit
LDLPEGLKALLEKYRVPLLGTPYESMNVIRNVPDLWKKLKALGVPVLSHAFAGDSASALREAANLGYPLLVRLSDQLLNPIAGIMYEEDMFRQFLGLHEECISEQSPIFMEVYQEGLVSAQMVALCDGEEATTLALIENIEEYGVHSGDCASAVPSLSIGDLIRSSAEDALHSIVSHFRIVGHLQLELAIRGRNVYVTGVWPHPGWNTALAEKAIQQEIHTWVSRLLLGEKIGDLKISVPPRSQRFYVKEVVFPFSRFPSLNPVLSPRMQSTGQVLGIESSFGKAYFKAQMAVNPKIPERGKIFLSARDTEKEAFLEVSKRLLKLGFSLVSTEGTAQFLASRGIEVNVISKVSGGRPNVIDLIINGEISLVINIPGGVRSKRDEQAIYRATIEHNIPLVTTTSGAYLFIRGIEEIRKSPPDLFPMIS